MIDSLKGSDSNLLIPVSGSLESDQALRITSDNGSSLSSDTSLVLVPGYLEMLSVLLDLLCDIVNGLHGVNVGLLDDYLEVLREVSLLLRLAIDNVQLLALVGTQAVL